MAPSPEALALLDAVPCGVVQTRDDGTFLRANRTFCQWVGSPADALVGKKRFQDLLTMGGRIFHQTHWAPLLRMQGSISEVKLELVHTGGSVYPVVVNAVLHQEDGGIVQEIAAYVARDRDKYEKELVLSRNRLKDLVAEANRLHAEAKDRALFAEHMMGIVSHDLRNPLSSVVMGTSLLARGELTVAQQNILARVTRATERANRLIEDLLDFTQVRVGKGLAISPSAIDFHDTVAQAVDELSLIYPRRQLEHVRRGEGGCSADAHRLAQLVGNLVSNAVTYGTPDTPVTVTTIIDAQTFSVAVHNHGAPIPVEAQAALFSPMTRGTTANSAARSVGLGLFIVREIARAHGGAASVTSTDEAGTTFRATFPRGPR